VDSALIHRARLVGQKRGAVRSAQGSYAREPIEAPWIPARVMERGAVAAKSRRGQQTTEARVQRGYELLIGPVDEDGAPVEKPTASARFETDCPILGNPTIELSGEPEVLTNGVDLIGYMAYGDVPGERS